MNKHAYSKHIPVLAKLLARDKVSVEFDENAPTAYFNLESRVVTLPIWKDLTEQQQEMLIGHEVAHAKYTPLIEYEENVHVKPFLEKDKKTKKLVPPQALLMTINVVEDARIERLLLREFPGFTPTFRSAYKSFDDIGFFDPPDKSKPLNLIDKINMHFKLGVSGEIDKNITFTPEEQKWIDRIEAAETYEKVVEIACQLYEHEKQNLKTVKVTTVEAFERALDGKRAAQGGQISGVAKVKTNLERMPRITKWTSEANTSALLDTWVGTAKQVAHQMYSAFLRKQKAHVFANSRQHKLGQLDVRRMSRYQIMDDVFRRKTLQPIGKRHGFVFIVDCSSSMQSTITAVWKQLGVMLYFARAAQIPFEVYAFSGSHGSSHGRPRRFKEVTPIHEMWLSNIMSSRMARHEIDEMLSHCLSGRWQREFPMTYTPLNSAAITMFKIVPQFREVHMVERLSVIFLSDGEATDHNVASVNDHTVASHIVDEDFSFISKAIDHPGKVTARILELLRHRTGATLVMWFLTDNVDHAKQAMRHADIEQAMDGILYLPLNKINAGDREYNEFANRFIDLIA